MRNTKQLQPPSQVNVFIQGGVSMAGKRMIKDDISRSAKIAKLSPKALALFCLLIPHFDSYGKMQAHPFTIKGTVCPLIDWLPVEEIEQLLQEISEHTNVKYFQHTDGLYYLHSLNWANHQTLRKDRLGADKLPDCSGSIPEQLRPEVEVQVEIEVEGKRKGQKEADIKGGSVKGETTLPHDDILEAQRRLEKKRKERKNLVESGASHFL